MRDLPGQLFGRFTMMAGITAAIRDRAFAGVLLGAQGEAGQTTVDQITGGPLGRDDDRPTARAGASPPQRQGRWRGRRTPRSRRSSGAERAPRRRWAHLAEGGCPYRAGSEVAPRGKELFAHLIAPECATRAPSSGEGGRAHTSILPFSSITEPMSAPVSPR
jgi:hypothetical protein